MTPSAHQPTLVDGETPEARETRSVAASHALASLHTPAEAPGACAALSGAELLQAVAGAIAEAILVKDHGGRYCFINDAAATLLARPADAVIGRTDADLFDAEYAAEQQAVDAQVLAEGRVVVMESAALHCGSTRRFHLTKSPLADARGHVVGVVIVKRDVTDARRLEAALREAQKMEAVGRTAAGAAHDFNNLLAGIRGFAELLLPTFAVADPRVDDVREIVQAVDRGREITRQLLTFGRRHEPSARVVGVDAIVDGLMPLLRRVAGGTVTVVREGSADGAVLVDPSLLEQVLVNLVANARDASAPGGVVTVRTSRQASAQACVFRNGTLPPGSYVLMAVRDEGVGMSPAVLDRLFEPLFTTKPPGTGTGLGLATAYGIVTQAGGALDVRSTEGAGTTVTVWLPDVRRAPPNTARSQGDGVLRDPLVGGVELTAPARGPRT